ALSSAGSGAAASAAAASPPDDGVSSSICGASRGASMFASSIFGAAIVALAVFAIAGPGALIVAALGIPTLPGSTLANAILGVTVASGALAGVGRTAASSEDEGVSLIISCLPMGDPQYGGEFDPMAGSEPAAVPYL